MRRLFSFLPLLLLVLGAAIPAQGQIQVGIDMKRTLYLRYEPMICLVSIRNLSGRDLELKDTRRHAWFGFDITTPEGRPIPPRADYQNQPLRLRAGETIRRPVNLTPLFPVTEFGTYRVRAAVYVPEFDKYFSSPTAVVEVTEGRILWEQTVGVPPNEGLDGKRRTYQVIAHRLPNTTMIYVRVKDPDRGLIYCTTRLGRYLTFGNPDVLLDNKNDIHILQNLAPRQFLYSHFGLDGKVRTQQAYQDWGTRPVFTRTLEGGVEVVGGTKFDPSAPPPERQLPGLGEAPVELPKPGGGTPRKKEDQEEDRPENLLSR